MVTSSFNLTELDPQLISDLCLSKHGSICFKHLPFEKVIDTCFEVENMDYLSVLYLFALLQGIAVTVHENKLVIYNAKEPFEIAIRSVELGQ